MKMHHVCGLGENGKIFLRSACKKAETSTGFFCFSLRRNTAPHGGHRQRKERNRENKKKIGCSVSVFKKYDSAVSHAHHSAAVLSGVSVCADGRPVGGI